MEIKYICTYWGKGYLPVSKFIAKALKAGFDGVEVNVPFDKKFASSLQKAVRDTGTILIAQQHLPTAIETFDNYRSKMKDYLQFLAGLNPLFINSHTGKDFYSFDQNAILIEDCLSIARQTGIMVVHETHRGRFAYHAASLLPYIRKFGNIKITADFSHFCVVSESLLEDQVQILEEIIPHCSYIHARLGYSQSAQVNHPFAPEWQDTLELFIGWWKRIIEIAKFNGEKTFYICPEFGPAPYMPALPFTLQPVSDQWDINVRMMEYLKENLQ